MQHAITFVIAALCILAIAYRLYGVFFVRKVLQADDSQVTPSHQLEDGKNYVPTNRWVNFGQHFAAIAAAGIRAVLSAWFCHGIRVCGRCPGGAGAAHSLDAGLAEQKT